MANESDNVNNTYMAFFQRGKGLVNRRYLKVTSMPPMLHIDDFKSNIR
jgi:hypothetical protein